MWEPNIEGEILRLLSVIDSPLKARAIAALLSGDRTPALHKRDINPILYRMLSEGRVRLDGEFRWSLTDAGRQLISKKSEHLSPSPQIAGRDEGIESLSTIGQDREVSEPERLLSSTPHVPASTALSTSKDYGKFKLVQESRPYERHCTWCSEKIPSNTVALVVYGVTKWRPRFCSEDCFKGWESVFWQRIALSHLGLSSEEVKREHRYLRLQRYFSKFR
jgi:hypothetical protein